MPVLLPPAFCSATDVQNLLSTLAVDLRLGDDDASATGQYIQATALASIGATTLNVMPLEVAVNAGAHLWFYGADQSVESEVIFRAAFPAGATSLSVNALTNPVNAGAVALDSGVNVIDWNRLANPFIPWASAQIKRRLNVKYDDSALLQCWSVNEWATILTAYRLCQRRLNAVPGVMQKAYDDAIADMKEVQSGAMYLEDVGLRTTECFAWSNVTLDQFGYNIRKVRVQQPISESTPTQYAQNVSWPAQFCFEI
jgi:hypothetical protein